jgi:ribonuclease HI
VEPRALVFTEPH